MSDLQCAVTFLLAAAGDEGQARALAERLRDRRVAVVYTDDAPATGEAVGALSAMLSAPVRSEPDLREAVVPPGAVLEQLADLHRGETVLVFARAQALTAAVQSLATGAGRTHAHRNPLAPGQSGELRGDADGWVVDDWMGQTPGA
ncbi:MAG: histidine phosphatase family protein [Actinomycetota bacterium]|nr:histidine phosphatase family protein [Actinomycetota bacterium]